jgi:phosphatidylserine/phosphatidylglycerophosphate/cardiolipin synthase-like enzyme
MGRSLIVLPDDTAQPIVEAIACAKRRVRIKMFAFSDPALLTTVVAARRRHVDVRVILNAKRRSGERDNEQTRTALEQADVEVCDANPAFEVTHEKSMVVDDETAFIKSFNWLTVNLTETRDYAVVTTSPREVAEVIEGFEADWYRQCFEPGPKSRMIWCPGPGRARICQFIDSAREWLIVENERYQDTVIIERLVRAVKRGVKVQVLARLAHTLKPENLVEGIGGLRILEDVGASVHTLKHLKLHGKMLLADGLSAIVGSINLARGSLDKRRELAIEVCDADVVDRLQRVAVRDWKHSRPMDLTDKGLLADLGDRVEGSRRLLALHEQ